MGKGRHLRVDHTRASGKKRAGQNRRLTTLTLAFATVLVVGAVAWASHGDPYIDLTTADAEVLHDGAVFIQGGSGAGTGNFDPFLQVQESGQPSDGIEEGYNTEPASNGEFDTKSINAGNTHKLPAASVPTLEHDGTLYREFSLDANDAGSDSFMSIDEIKIFLDDQFALTDYDNIAETFGTDSGDMAAKIYDLDLNSETTILANTQSLEPGSGVSDITVLIPDSLFPEQCYYGSLDCDLYIIFWTRMGALAEDPDSEGRDYDADSGFEEWRVRRQPVVNVSKTAETSLTRTHAWEVTKSVLPATQDGFIGGTAGTSTWSVVVDETETDSALTVSGQITITNPTDPASGVFDDPEPAVIESVTDAIDLATGTDYSNVTVTCPETLPFTLAAGEELVCGYSQAIADIGDGTGTNTATVEISDGQDFFDSFDDVVAFDFVDATVTHSGPEEVTVGDDRDTEGNFPDTISDDATYDYDETFDCSSDPADYTDGVDTDQYDNTATIKDGDTLIDSDEASVTVTCYLPSVSKTAAGTNDETHNWTIDKTPDATYHLFAGDDVDHEYDIELDETVVSDNYQVTGTVTITNPHPSDAAVVTLADQLSDGTSVTFTDCVDVDAADGLQVSVPAGSPGSLDCVYTASDPNGDATSNTATITINGVSQSTDPVAFDYVPNVTNPSVNVTDDNGTPDDAGTPEDETADDRTFGPFSEDVTTGYTQTYDCSSDPSDYTDGTYDYTVVNTAAIDETGASDTATVTVNCYLPGVSKTASGSYTETHTWEITKESDATYHLVAGDDVDHDYDITVDETITNSGYTVSGTVTLTNPHPTDAAEVTLSDALDDGTVVSFDNCSDANGVEPGLQVSVPAGGSVDCNYSQAEDGDNGNATANTATMVFNGITQTDPQSFTYSPTPSGPDTVNVTDDYGTPDDAGTPEDETSDDLTFGPLVDDGLADYQRTFECSSDPADYTNGTYNYTVVNTATIDETGDSDDATVTVNCYLPLVSKTADTSFTRTYNWVIEKDALLAEGGSVPAEGLTLAFGQSYNLEWEIAVDLDGTTPYTDSDWAIDGVVTVTNPAPAADGPSMTVDVTDWFTPDGAPAVPVIVDCDAVTPDDQNTGIVIAAGTSVDCTYSVSTDGTNGVNEATATLDTLASNSDTEDVDFGDAAADITEVNATIQVTDTFEGGSEEVLGSASVTDTLPKVFSYFTLLSSDPTDNPDFLLQCGEQTITNQTDMYNFDDDPTLGVNLGFDTRDVIVTVNCDLGCTLTQGYWKTHNDSFWGGAPTDETWELIGDVDGDGLPEAEDEEFFGSGQTWFEVFWTPPQGNAYYNLAHQWMAAYLNTLTGASVPAEVQAALDAAETWFEGYSPEDGADLKGKEAKFLRDWASTLDDYNNGVIGPGHCDEDGFSLLAVLPLLPLLPLTVPKVRKHLRRKGRYLERGND